MVRKSRSSEQQDSQRRCRPREIRGVAGRETRKASKVRSRHGFHWVCIHRCL